MFKPRLWWANALLITTLLMCASAQKSVSYTVQAGDSLYTIAHKFHLRLGDVLKENKLRNPHAIKPGMVLKIPLLHERAAKVAPKVNQPKQVKPGWAELNTDRVNVRRAPGKDAERLTLVDRWTKVQVLTVQKDWAKVRLASGQTGWMITHYLNATEAPKKQVVQTRSARKSKTRQVAVHSRSRTSNRTVRKPRSKGVQIASMPPSDSSDPVVRRAYSLQGRPYRYGGMTSRGFDCSGFTRYVYSKYGKNLPHNSAAQAKVGKPVPKSELKPGDLVFFRTRGNRISHVGVYIGNGKFIHASSARGRVRIDSLNEGYYNNRYAGARRVK